MEDNRGGGRVATLIGQHIQGERTPTLEDLQADLDTAWARFFSLSAAPWDVQRIAADHVIALRQQITALGADEK